MSSHNPVCYGPGVPNLQAYHPPLISQRDPTTSDINYPLGFIWDNELLNKGWFLSSKSAGLANWILFAVAGGVGIDTITGSSGGALSPTAGNLNILGTPNQVNSIGSASTLTLSIPATFIAPGSIASTTTLTGGTSITATLGNITATNGNLVLGTSGNKIDIATGSNASTGISSPLSGTPGTLIISTSAVTASSIIQISRNTPGGTLGNISVPSASIVPGVSFVINSDANETSTINWWIIN